MRAPPHSIKPLIWLTLVVTFSASIVAQQATDEVLPPADTPYIPIEKGQDYKIMAKISSGLDAEGITLHYQQFYRS